MICGSVAVSPRGVRIGKGAGYSDIEVALLTEAGLLTDRTTIVTTVDDLQVVDDNLPETDHDFSVDVIVTPTRVLFCISSTAARIDLGPAFPGPIGRDASTSTIQ